MRPGDVADKFGKEKARKPMSPQGVDWPQPGQDGVVQGSELARDLN